MLDVEWAVRTRTVTHSVVAQKANAGVQGNAGRPVWKFVGEGTLSKLAGQHSFSATSPGLGYQKLKQGQKLLEGKVFTARPHQKGKEGLLVPGEGRGHRTS